MNIDIVNEEVNQTINGNTNSYKKQPKVRRGKADHIAKGAGAWQKPGRRDRFFQKSHLFHDEEGGGLRASSTKSRA